jgi:hypothetical protein
MMRKAKKAEKQIADQKKNAPSDPKKEPEKKRRRRVEKPREPNVRGGILTLISLCVLYLVINANAHSPAVLGTSDAREYERMQAQKAKAEENIKEDLEDTAKGVRGNFTETNPVDAAVASVEKVNHDIEAAKNLPAQTVETVKNMKIGDAVTIVMESVSRLKKIISDANGVKKEALKQVEKMQ